MYQLNEKTDLLNVNTLNALTACSKMLKMKYPNAGAELILFGSHVKGSADPESDIDLLVLVNDDVNSDWEKEIHDSIYEISLDYDVVMSAIILSKQRWDSPTSKILPLYQNIESEGVRVA